MLRMDTAKGAGRALTYYQDSLLQEELKEFRTLTACGTWHGKLAGRLGLAGEVTARDFASVLGNIHPTEGGPLTPRTKLERRCGFEVGLSSPKSLTLMHEITNDHRLYAAFVESVHEAMGRTEGFAETRVRREGADESRKTGELAWALFVHRTARPVSGVSDPQLHAHCFVVNATWDPVEKRVKALELGEAYRILPLLEAEFSSVLARRVQELGYSVRVKGKFWEIDGVPDAIIEKFSRRTDQIESVADKLGIEDPRELDALGAKTRERKGNGIGVTQLRGLWSGRLSGEEFTLLQALRDRSEGVDHSTRENGSTREDGPTSQRPKGAGGEDRRRTASEEGTGQRHSTGPEPDVDGHQHDEGTATRPLSEKDRRLVAEAVRLEAGRLFERAAVVPEYKLLDVGLRAAPGRAKLEHVREEMAAQGVITRVIDGRAMVTTREAVQDEQRLVGLAVQGKGQYPDSARRAREVYPRLTPEQAEAVAVVLESPDLVTVVRGRAGVGKTHLTQVAVREIWSRIGRPVCMLAPTAKAARGVLREEGHKHADTVAKFMVSESLQARARYGVIWVDEAGMLGVKDTIRLLDKAISLGARVVLMGDDRQHHAVTRGTPLETLVRHAGVRQATVDGVLRQKGAYKAAVEALVRGDVPEAVRRLDAMRAIQVVGKDRLYETAAADFVESRCRKENVLLVAPTHAEGRATTEHIRRMLRERGELGQGHSYESLVGRDLTEFDRGLAGSYRPGDVVQFHRKVAGHGRGTFKSNERWTVLGQDPFGNVLVTRGGLSIPQALPLKRADCWSVFETKTIDIAVGDTVRFTYSARLQSRIDSLLKLVMPSKREGTHAVARNDMHTVAKVWPSGRMLLGNGLVVPKGFGHLAHGYCVTSQGAQGTTVDRVIGVQSVQSGPAASARQFYVTVTRGRKSVRVYTDDRVALVDAVTRHEGELSALGLMERGVTPDTHQRQRQAADRQRRAMAEEARRAQEQQAERQRSRAMGG